MLKNKIQSWLHAYSAAFLRKYSSVSYSRCLSPVDSNITSRMQCYSHYIAVFMENGKQTMTI